MNENVSCKIERFLWTSVYLTCTLFTATLIHTLWNMKHDSLSGLAFTLNLLSQARYGNSVDLNWYPPSQTQVNSLSSVLNGTGVYGFIFNSSVTPTGEYGVYNWCNMPHVRAQEYSVPSDDWELTYVEVIHRHHKRTPYASNAFPIEPQAFPCGDALVYSTSAEGQNTARVAWNISTSALNPFQPAGFPDPHCLFPQITDGGLQDSHQHGLDLSSVYGSAGLLSFLPKDYDPSLVQFYVTNNQITSQVASELIPGLFSTTSDIAVNIQPATVDSLEPTYTCSYASNLFSAYGVGSKSANWTAHLNASSTRALFSALDSVSGVNSTDSGWHNWFDHYFDNLSAKLCHNLALPCNITNSSLCVTHDMANAVFRRGEYEYSYIYRDAPQSLNASVASYGVWLGQLAAHLRAAADSVQGQGVRYRHNIAHDGSMSRLLSVLQIDVMVWPGMGSEVVFELWENRKESNFSVRVLWGGKVLTSSSPTLGKMDMLDVNVLLAYIDGLVGVSGSKVPALCAQSSTV